jgi:hypothetical protein
MYVSAALVQPTATIEAGGSAGFRIGSPVLGPSLTQYGCVHWLLDCAVTSAVVR